MAITEGCPSVTFSTKLKDLQRAYAEFKKSMGIHHLQTEIVIKGLAGKLPAQEKLNLENEAEKARLLEEKAEVRIDFHIKFSNLNMSLT